MVLTQINILFISFDFLYIHIYIFIYINHQREEKSYCSYNILSIYWKGRTCKLRDKIFSEKKKS